MCESSAECEDNVASITFPNINVRRNFLALYFILFIFMCFYSLPDSDIYSQISQTVILLYIITLKIIILMMMGHVKKPLILHLPPSLYIFPPFCTTESQYYNNVYISYLYSLIVKLKSQVL